MQTEASCLSKVALVSLTALGLLLKISHILPFRLEVSLMLWRLLVKLVWRCRRGLCGDVDYAVDKE